MFLMVLVGFKVGIHTTQGIQFFCYPACSSATLGQIVRSLLFHVWWNRKGKGLPRFSIAFNKAFEKSCFYSQKYNFIFRFLYMPKSEYKNGFDVHEIVTRSWHGCQNYWPQFLVSGHSHLTNDGYFGITEKTSQKE